MQTNVGKGNESSRVDWLKQTLLKIPAGGKILDPGVGEQPFRKYCTHLRYMSQDFAQYDPQKVNSGLQMNEWNYGELDIVSDIASIPEPNESFDAIMCTEVLEHIINPREAISEFSRLLRPGGYLIITAPFCSLTHFAPYHFYTGFNKFFYETALNSNKLKIIEIVPNGNYFEYLAQELRRLDFVAKKYTIDYKTNFFDKTIMLRYLQILGKLSKKITNRLNYYVMDIMYLHRNPYDFQIKYI